MEDLAIRSARQAPPSQRERGIRYSRQVKTPAEAYAGPGSKPRPSEEEPPETDPCRHHRTAGSATTPTPRRRHAPRTPGGPQRLDSSHAAGRSISPPCRRRPAHRSARTPPGTWPPRSARTGAPMPQPGLVLSAGRRARKNSAAPHTRQRPPPLAVKCAELPPLPQRSTGRRNPIPQHPHSATNRIARRCGASPPTSRASVAGGANLAFADPRHPGARPTCVRRATAPRVPRRKPGEPVKGCSITGRAANGRRPPQAVQTLFAVPHQVAARPACARRTSCHRNQGEKRMNPVMQVPCQNRPHLLPTGRWSGGRMRRRAMR